MSLDPASQLALASMIAALLMLLLWCIQWRTRDAGIVDVGWAGCLGFLAIFYGSTNPDCTWRTWMVVTIASVWSLRLAIYLLRDRVLGKPEDGRYQKLRAGFGSRANLFFLGFFQVQALLAWFFSLAFWLAMRRSGPMDVWDLFGISIWLISVAGETLADSQLARFRANTSNRGTTCRSGLWKYSRHPNYFFEWLHWWTYVAIAWTSPLGWMTLAAPALMLFFLLKVTGIPATEAQALISRGADYRKYQQTTSMFIPWFPKKFPD
ncbi:MAG: DUF1295 domain-containing protein [Schlesneria sp.]